jgi:hypothetical protein
MGPVCGRVWRDGGGQLIWVGGFASPTVLKSCCCEGAEAPDRLDFVIQLAQVRVKKRKLFTHERSALLKPDCQAI